LPGVHGAERVLLRSVSGHSFDRTVMVCVMRTTPTQTGRRGRHRPGPCNGGETELCDTTSSVSRIVKTTSGDACDDFNRMPLCLGQ